MNKADLIEALAPQLGGRVAATHAVEVLVDTIMREVASGGSVALTGFGTFEKVDRAARTGRNPRTGEAVPIEATSAPRFRPGAYFKDVVSDPDQLPSDGLAGVRVSGDGATPRPTSGPTSVGRPSTVRADAPKAARKKAAEASPAAASGGRVLSGGEEITASMITAKKAQLARVKDDELSAKDAKKARKAKNKATSSDKDKGKDGKSKKSKKGKKKS
ncbi:HU family DNA-binding protein [Ornithinimicrobium sp. Y1847]|uniref:HU family DNA-binding protein n=1 Tax=unclassified Ornithinimicrobium TaxID=2615080 RepID=UPI003B677C9D